MELYKGDRLVGKSSNPDPRYVVHTCAHSESPIAVHNGTACPNQRFGCAFVAPVLKEKGIQIQPDRSFAHLAEARYCDLILRKESELADDLQISANGTEFALCWLKSTGPDSPRLFAYSEAWPVLADLMPALLALGESVTVEQAITRLIDLGFEDTTLTTY